MKVKTPQTGGVVKSIQGRDRGAYYVISEVLEGGRLALTDGTKRKLSNPKIKNLKHVSLLPLSVSFERNGAYDNQVAYYIKSTCLPLK